MKEDTHGQLLAPDTVRIERLMPGPIERLWTWLTDSDKRSRWLAAGAMQLHAGGAVEHLFRNNALSAADDPPPPRYAAHAEHTMHGQVLACEPPRLLRYRWGEGDLASDVTFELSPQGDQVRLVVTHRRLASRDMVLSVAAGWHAHLAILAARLDEAPAPSFWSLHTRLEREYGERLPAPEGRTDVRP
jgi:uncharacterized protein YndB with AHSA1/START domain